MTRQIHSITQFLALRILVWAGGQRNFVESSGGFAGIALADATSLTEYLDNSNQNIEELDRRQRLKILEELRTKTEGKDKSCLQLPVLSILSV